MLFQRILLIQIVDQKIIIAMLLIYSNLFAAPTSATDANKTKEIV
jgi:hypothetical protein